MMTLTGSHTAAAAVSAAAPHRGARRQHGHALRCTSELLRRERSIGLTREFHSRIADRRLSTRQAMDGSDGSMRDAQVVLRESVHVVSASIMRLREVTTDYAKSVPTAGARTLPPCGLQPSPNPEGLPPDFSSSGSCHQTQFRGGCARCCARSEACPSRTGDASTGAAWQAGAGGRRRSYSPD